MSEHAEHVDHEHPNYVRVWAILVALLAVSVIGPMFEVQVLTLVTAFGIACVKAYLVAKNFMHIRMEPRYISYIVVTALVFMLLFFAGTAPDVMEESGSNWVKDPAWQFHLEDAGHATAPQAGSH